MDLQKLIGKYIKIEGQIEGTPWHVEGILKEVHSDYLVLSEPTLGGLTYWSRSIQIATLNIRGEST